MHWPRFLQAVRCTLDRGTEKHIGLGFGVGILTLDMGVSKTRGAITWTEINRIPHTKAPKIGPAFMETPIYLQ